MPMIFTPGPMPQPATPPTPAAPFAAPVRERLTCRACDTKMLESVLDLGTMYLPRFVSDVTVPQPTAPLHLVRCGRCGLLQLQHTCDPGLLFGEFWYRSGINQSMRDSLKELVDDALTMAVPHGTWVDVGANDGTLLSFVPPYLSSKTGFRRVGVEPALNLASDLALHADQVVSDYFGFAPLAHLKGKVDVITSAAMFYDLDDPHPFLDAVYKLLAINGIWINQLNDSPTMMKMNAVDSVCHEHLTYYDLHSLKKLYAQHGLTIVNLSFNDVNGGSMRVTARKDSPNLQIDGMTAVPRVSQHDAESFAARTVRWKELMGWTLESLRLGKRKVWGYGASTKGAILLQHLGGQPVAKIADRNPLKHGRKLAGPWCEIVDEAAMRTERPDVLLVLPWAFRKEFIEREAATREAGTALLFPLPNMEWIL